MTKRIMSVAIVLVAVCLLAAITTGLTAQPLQEQQTVTPHVGTDAPPTTPVQGGLIWFNDKAAFEAFMQDQGKVLKGIEDFEESILDPNNVDGFDDPLESGVPNLPDGFPFPDGMTGLPNLIVQSNVLGGNPTVPDPAGVSGLAAVSDGFGEVVSDGVVSNQGDNGLDLIFTEEKSGIGFNTINVIPLLVEVRVYSTTNDFLGMMPTPADPAGTNFIGMWSDIPLGRINIFAPDNSAEGADNIQAWEAAGTCPWDLDDSGSVGASDLLTLLASWGPCKGCPADFDGNGNVGASDLLALLVNWGPCP
ncbi:MAG: hypothetical protein V3T53_07740 [Phycisphaerales bacterium]